MPDPKFVLTNKAGSSSTGATLNGSKIKVTNPPFPGVPAYEFYPPGATTYAAKVESSSLPVTFTDVSITKGNVTTTWDITVISLPSATDAGSWVTPSQAKLKSGDVPPTSGEFTAQTDGAFAEEAAASAGHGKK